MNLTVVHKFIRTLGGERGAGIKIPKTISGVFFSPCICFLKINKNGPVKKII